MAKREKVKTASERTQRLLKKTVRVDPKTPIKNSQGKDQRTFEGGSYQVGRWRVRKRKEEEWKKKKRKTRKKVKYNGGRNVKSSSHACL